MEVDAAELAQHQTVGDVLLRLFVTEVVKVLHRQHAHNYFYRCGLATATFCLRVTASQVVADETKQLIIVQYLINSRQFRVHLDGQARHTPEYVVRLMFVD